MSCHARIVTLLACTTLTLGGAGAYVSLAGTGTPARKSCRAVYAAVRSLHDEESLVVQADASHAYAARYHLPLSVAYARMKMQDVSVPLIPAITATLARRAGGTWFERGDCGRLEVGVSGTADPLASHAAHAAMALVARHHLAAVIRFVSVRWSEAQLNAAYRQISGRLESLSRDGKVEIHTDPETNSVVIETAKTLMTDERAQVAAAARSVAVTTHVKRTRKESLGFKLAMFRHR